MSGIYIPGMEMPRGCASCKISRRNGKKMICPFIWKCEWDIHDPMSADHRLDGCPLVPAADVQPVRHGRWTKTIGENGVTSACRCNLCGFEDNRYSLFNYCPNCGAKMDGEA